MVQVSSAGTSGWASYLIPQHKLPDLLLTVKLVTRLDAAERRRCGEQRERRGAKDPKLTLAFCFACSRRLTSFCFLRAFASAIFLMGRASIAFNRSFSASMSAFVTCGIGLHAGYGHSYLSQGSSTCMATRTWAPRHRLFKSTV